MQLLKNVLNVRSELSKLWLTSAQGSTLSVCISESIHSSDNKYNFPLGSQQHNQTPAIINVLIYPIHIVKSKAYPIFHMESQKKLFIGGNWKSNNTIAQTTALVQDVLKKLEFDNTKVGIFLC